MGSSGEDVWLKHFSRIPPPERFRMGCELALQDIEGQGSGAARSSAAAAAAPSQGGMEAEEYPDESQATLVVGSDDWLLAEAHQRKLIRVTHT